MTPEEQKEVHRLFRRAYDLFPTERGAFLEETCGDRADIRREVEALLEADAELDEFEPASSGIAGLTAQFPKPVASTLVEGGRAEHIGPYRLEDVLGRGGQGTVYLAVDTRLDRKVALKVLASPLALSSNAKRRFRREADIASRVDHPGIAAVYEFGEEEGVSYIAMRYVKGESLSERIAATSKQQSRVDADSSAVLICAEAERDSSGNERIRELLTFIEKAARALHAAHEAGLVHRDVKPGNILITTEGEPVVVDFGLARDIEGDQPSLTHSGDLLGTPRYLSPEQLAAHRIELDRRTDVYSLGVTLYECLTLRPPFEAATRDGLYQKILATEPSNPRRLNRHISRDLAVVIETAIEKNRERRYATALDFAEDLRRVRELEPIRARPAGSFLRLGRWAQRNPALAAALFATFVLFAVGLAVAVAYNRRLSQSLVEARALGLAGASQQALDFDPMLSLLLAREAVRTKELPDTVSRLHAALASVHEVRSIEVGKLGGRAVDVSPDGRRFVTVGGDAAAILDFDGKEEVLLPAGDTGCVSIVSFSHAPGPIRILTASGDEVRLWDINGTLLRTLDHGSEVHTAHFSVVGDKVLILTASEESVKLWDTDGRRIPVAGGWQGTVERARLGPDDTGIVIASSGALSLWSLDGHRIREFEGLEAPATSLAVSRDGTYLAASLSDHTVRLWDVASGEMLETYRQFQANARSVVFSPAGDLLLAASGDQTARLFDLQGKEIVALRGHQNSLDGVAFSPRGDWIITSSWDGTCRIWSLSDRELPVLRGQHGEIMSASFSREGDTVLTASQGQSLRMWTAEGELTCDIHVSPVYQVCRAVLSPVGNEILSTTGEDPTVNPKETGEFFATLLDREGKVLRRFGPHKDRVTSVAFSNRGDLVLTGCEDGTAVLWDRFSARRLRVFHDPEWWGVLAVEISPDGNMVLVGTGSWDNAGSLWDIEGNLIAKLIGHGDKLRDVAFSPDGHRVLTASGDSTARLWDLEGHLLQSFEGHQGAVWACAFSPDGRRIATGARDQTVRLWDLGGHELAVLRGHRGPVWSVAFSPDGKRLLSASSDGTARFWAVDTKNLLEITDRRLERAKRDFTAAERERYCKFLAR